MKVAVASLPVTTVPWGNTHRTLNASPSTSCAVACSTTASPTRGLLGVAVAPHTSGGALTTVAWAWPGTPGAPSLGVATTRHTSPRTKALPATVEPVRSGCRAPFRSH